MLLLILGVAAFMQQKNSKQDGTVLSIYENGQQVYVCSLRQLMSMESVQVPVRMQSAKKREEQGNYQGVWLASLLEKAGVKEYGTVVLSAGDGYSAAASGSEAESVLIAYGIDGDTLGYYGRGGTGPIRAVFTKDIYGNRSVQYLTRIEVRTK